MSIGTASRGDGDRDSRATGRVDADVDPVGEAGSVDTDPHPPLGSVLVLDQSYAPHRQSTSTHSSQVTPGK